jgi:hypothetical protein
VKSLGPSVLIGGASRVPAGAMPSSRRRCGVVRRREVVSSRVTGPPVTGAKGRGGSPSPSRSERVEQLDGVPPVLATELTVVSVDDVKPHPRNPRRGDVGAIVESIVENGVYRPIVVQRSTGYIIAGSHTWQAMKATGVARAPVIMLDVDDKAAVKIMLADNKTADRGDYDDAGVAALLQELVGDGEIRSLLGTGYDADDLDDMLNDLAREHVEFEALGAPADHIMFKFGDHSGNVSPTVYTSFKQAFNKQRRENGGDVLLDDVLKSWLGLR